MEEKLACITFATFAYSLLATKISFAVLKYIYVNLNSHSNSSVDFGRISPCTIHRTRFVVKRWLTNLALRPLTRVTILLYEAPAFCSLIPPEAPITVILQLRALSYIVPPAATKFLYKKGMKGTQQYLRQDVV
jgi:hypothetical protein